MFKYLYVCISACNCHRHADECVYNSTVAEKGLSLNIRGEFDGGGVCLNCRVSTELFLLPWKQKLKLYAKFLSFVNLWGELMMMMAYWLLVLIIIGWNWHKDICTYSNQCDLMTLEVLANSNLSWQKIKFRQHWHSSCIIYMYSAILVEFCSYNSYRKSNILH